MITVYSDRIEILSRGSLAPEQTMEGFFAGESVPVNKKLSEIFLLALPGAVSLSLDANGEPENFYADGIAYYVINNNMGYEGDQKHIRHILYNCSASRPKIEGQTNEDTKEVQTETLSIKATPLSDGMVKAKRGNPTYLPSEISPLQ